MKDDQPSAAEQFAFSQAYELVKRLREEDGLDQADIGAGLLIAALSQLREAVGDKETARLLYLYADDYATRD